MTNSVEKPIIKEIAKPIINESISVTAELPDKFPTTNQFDTSFEDPAGPGHNWSSSFFGLSTERFPKEIEDILLAPIDPEDIEIKPGIHTSY